MIVWERCVPRFVAEEFKNVDFFFLCKMQYGRFLKNTNVVSIERNW